MEGSSGLRVSPPRTSSGCDCLQHGFRRIMRFLLPSAEDTSTARNGNNHVLGERTLSSTSERSLSQKKSRRPSVPRIRGHRFSKESVEPLLSSDVPSSPCSDATMPSSNWPLPAHPPPPDAPHIYLLDPGSGEACGALQRLATLHVHLAVGPEFDQPVKRYPPHWRSMRGVKLTEAEAEQEALQEAEAAKEAEFGSRSWPGVSDLRGSAHPRNLATWASALYETTTQRLHAVDLTECGCDRAAARHLQPMDGWKLLSTYSCLVCGSRGGEVTLPALWLLGCTLPAVVINGGCARKAAQWVWPAGVPVVMLTGGDDRICNEFWRQTDRVRALTFERVQQPRSVVARPLFPPSRARPSALRLICCRRRDSD